MATVLRNILTSLHGRLAGLANDGSLIIRGEPDQVTINAVKGATNIALVSIQAVNNEGLNSASVQPLTVWLSDSATGDGLAAHAPQTVAAGASGTVLGALTAAKAIQAVTNSLGLFIMSITDTSATAFVVCADLVGGRKTTVQTKALVAGNYGP